MKTKSIFFAVCVSIICVGCHVSHKNEMRQVVDRGLERAMIQSKLMAECLWAEKEKMPRTIGKDGKLLTASIHWWTSGFFPGVLWYLYEETQNDSIRQYAEDYTWRVKDIQYTTNNHDVGFMLNCSFGNGYRLTGNEEYKKVLLQGAESLSTRFNPIIGCIRSWDWNEDIWQYSHI